MVAYFDEEVTLVSKILPNVIGKIFEKVLKREGLWKAGRELGINYN